MSTKKPTPSLDFDTAMPDRARGTGRPSKWPELLREFAASGKDHALVVEDRPATRSRAIQLNNQLRGIIRNNRDEFSNITTSVRLEKLYLVRKEG